MKLLFVIALLTAVVIKTSAHETPQFFPEKYGEKRIQWNVGLTNQAQLYQGKLLVISGAWLGVQFNGVNQFGLTYNQLIMPMHYMSPICCVTVDDSPLHQLQYEAVSFFYRRTVYRSKFHEISIPITSDLANGVVLHQTNSNYLMTNKSTLVTGRIEIKHRWFITPWATLKYSIGHRLTLTADPFWNERFNSFYVTYGCEINLKKVWQVFTKNETWLWKKEKTLYP